MLEAGVRLVHVAGTTVLYSRKVAVVPVAGTLCASSGTTGSVASDTESRRERMLERSMARGAGSEATGSPDRDSGM
jgi:hypothetical protein